MYRVLEIIRRIKRERRLLCAVRNTAQGVSKKKNAITGFTSMIERIGRNAPTDAPKIRPHTWPDGAT